MLEAQVNRMLPLLDSELECVDRNHAKLTQLSTNLVEAINMYHILMRESESSQFYGVPHQNHFINHNPMANSPHSLVTAQQYQQLINMPTATDHQYRQLPLAPSGFVLPNPGYVLNTVMTTQIQPPHPDPRSQS